MSSCRLTAKLLSCLTIVAAFQAVADRSTHVGSSTVGLYVTPPAWATPAAAGFTVDVRWTPLGDRSAVLRLGDKAALGMCASVDGFCERFYSPSLPEYDPYRSQVGEWAWGSYDAGPVANWHLVDLCGGSFPFPTLTIAYATNRNMLAEWRRIFAKCSPMLEDVRKELRSLVLTGAGSSRGTDPVYGFTAAQSCLWWAGKPVSSSAFGGSNMLAFDWTTKQLAEDALVYAANTEKLCLDWTCLPDCRRRAQWALDGHIDNIVDRVVSSGPGRYTRWSGAAPLPPITNIMATACGDYPHNPAWLDRTNVTARIDVDDFGWFNSLIALLDKSYVVSRYNGLTYLQYSTLELQGNGTRTEPITNGSFHIWWDVNDGGRGAFSGLESGATSLVVGITTNSVDVGPNGEWSTSGVGASAACAPQGSLQLAVDANILAYYAVPALTNGEWRPITLSGDVDRDIGPILSYGVDGALAWEIPVLQITDTIPASGGSISTSARAWIRNTDPEHLPFRDDVLASWVTTNSGRAVIPHPALSNYIAKIELQAIGTRTHSALPAAGTPGSVNYKSAMAAGTEYRAHSQFNVQAAALDIQVGHLLDPVYVSCRDEVDDRCDGMLTTGLYQKLNDMLAECANEARQLGTNSATWGVQLDEEDIVLCREGDDYKLRYVHTRNELPRPAWSIAPLIVRDPNAPPDVPAPSQSACYLVGHLTAEDSNQKEIRHPDMSMLLETDISAAIFWRFQNLPLIDD